MAGPIGDVGLVPVVNMTRSAARCSAHDGMVASVVAGDAARQRAPDTPLSHRGRRSERD
jgi:hypothetical protein